MIKVILDPENGVGFSDIKAEKHFAEWLTNPTDIVVGNAIWFDSLRLAILQEKIKLEDLEISFNEEIVQMNKFGNVKKWPDGLFDNGIAVVENILITQSKLNSVN